MIFLASNFKLIFVDNGEYRPSVWSTGEKRGACPHVSISRRIRFRAGEAFHRSDFSRSEAENNHSWWAQPYLESGHPHTCPVSVVWANLVPFHDFVRNAIDESDFRCMGGIQNIRDSLFIHLYDEKIIDLVDDERLRETTIVQRTERYWLGSLRIPFTALYTRVIWFKIIKHHIERIKFKI